jgi:superfamily I DNA/RNA helicase
MQRALAHREYNGPVRVIGGPGTGKTVTALHRAAYLASQGQRVLLATYSRTLRDSLTDNLVKLAGRVVLEHVDVQTIDGVAHRVLMTMHRAKGLEFRAISVIGANSQNIPPRWLIPDNEIDAPPVPAAGTLPALRRLLPGEGTADRELDRRSQPVPLRDCR